MRPFLIPPMGGMNFLCREGNSPHETRECGRHCGAKFGTFIDREMRLTVRRIYKEKEDVL